MEKGLVMLHFKNSTHEKETYEISKNLGKNFGSDAYYDSFAYLAALSGKTTFIIKHTGTFGVNSEKIKEGMAPFSPSERNLISLGLQLFNASMSDIAIDDVIAPLSEENYKCVLEALQIRYGRVYT